MKKLITLIIILAIVSPVVSTIIVSRKAVEAVNQKENAVELWEFFEKKCPNGLRATEDDISTTTPVWTVTCMTPINPADLIPIKN